MLTRRESEVLAVIRENPLITQQELSRRLGMSRSSVAGYVMKLTEKGVIRGRGYVLNDREYVCVIGGANLDVEGRPSGVLQMQESNVGSVRVAAGGVGRNIAENLSRLGISTRLLTALGRDPNGAWLHDQTVAAGVDLTETVWCEAQATATYVSLLDGKGDMLAAVNDMSAIDTLDASALSGRRDTIARSALVVMDCNLSADAIGHLFETHSTQSFFVDTVSMTKSSRIKPYLSRVHTLKPNRLEASFLADIEIDNAATLDEAADRLLSQGVHQMFISLGSDGLFYASDELRGKLDPIVTDVASTTGAGDALMAGIVHGYLERQSTDAQAQLALAASSLTAQSSAAVSENISRDSLHRLVEEYSV